MRKKNKHRNKHMKVKYKGKFVRGIIIILAILAIIIYAIILVISSIVSSFKNKANENKKEQNNEKTNIVNQVQTNITNEENSKIVSGIPTEEITKEWNLKLANKNTVIQKDYVPELATIEKELKFDKRAIEYLNKMMTAIRKDKITSIWIQSSYRSYEKQEELFNNKVDFYKKEGKNQEEAEKLAQTVVQRPEYSEHNLGLAVDFNKVNNEFEDTKAFTWLNKNAQEYGFILRYPKDKVEITGITYEPWHWRYVGKEHAEIIKEKKYCLEEYIEYLNGVQEV